MFSWFKSARRRKLLASPFPREWLAHLNANVRQYATLPQRLQETLRRCTQIIASEREWVGCKGLEVTDEMRVTVAGNASLLLLGDEGYFFDRVPSILLYPTPYRRQQALGQSGIVGEEVGILGESWHRGSIVLSWPSVLSDCRGAGDGNNLVLHEFAHHLDSLDGAIEGMPPLPSRQARSEWQSVFAAEFDRLQSDLSAGRRTLLDPYGAESKAEFFAVATECFFERPAEMKARYADLYRIFAGLYRLEPASWSATSVREASTLNDEADAVADESDDEDLQPADLPALRTADDYFTRGHDYFHDGRFELAEADFSAVLRLRPDDQESLVYRAQARLALGNSSDALADAHHALRLEPDDPDARRVRGMALVDEEQFEEALLDLDSALDEHPDDLDALFYRGLAWVGVGKIERALIDFSEILHRDPSDAEAWYQRSQCHRLLGNQAAAAHDLARAQELDPEME